MLLDAAFGKGLLEDLQINDIFPLVSGFPVDSLHGKFARVHGIQKVTVNCSSPQLFYLIEVYMQCVINPINEVSLGHKEGALHHSYTFLIEIHLNIILLIIKPF